MSDPDLVQLMLARGLSADVAELSSAVASVGYYRLKGYLVPFRKPDTEDFRDGTDFSTVWSIYNFVRPQSKWRERCRALLQSADPFVLTGMGFPADWQSLALWQ